MKVTEIRKKLSKLICGQVLWDKEVINCYSVDSSSYMIKPKVVVFPNTRKDVIKIVKFASRTQPTTIDVIVSTDHRCNSVLRTL